MTSFVTGPAGVAIVLALGACTPPAVDRADEPGEELTTVTEPTQELTDSGGEPGGPEGSRRGTPSEAAPDVEGGGQPVSVELPGLPIGGDLVEFWAPSTECVTVNLSSEPLPLGVRAVVKAFEVPEAFSVVAAPCGGGPACLGGHAFTSDGGSCQVAVTWSGQPVDGEVAELSVSAGALTCEEESLCGSALSILEETGAQSIELAVHPPEEPDGQGSTETSSDAPAETPTGTAEPFSGDGSGDTGGETSGDTSGETTGGSGAETTGGSGAETTG